MNTCAAPSALSLDTLLRSRRSIRKYLPDLPNDELIRALTNAAAMAPSPSDSRPVRFLHIRSEQARSALCLALESKRQDWLAQIENRNLGARTRNFVNAYHRYSAFIADAPVLFAVGLVSTPNTFSRVLENAGLLDYASDRASSPQDISLGMALMNFSLKAQELGLACCVLTAPLFFVSNISAILKQDSISIRALLTAGFPNEVAIPKSPTTTDFLVEV